VAHDETPRQDPQSFVLPTQVFGVVEVRRLSRELEQLDDYLRQSSIREGGAKQASLPRLSRLLDTTASDNHLNLLQSTDRDQLAKALQTTLEQAPVVHLSFASDPSAAFLEKIVGWLRGNIHPMTLIRLGLQPSIAAGCVMRTANKSFDFSLRHRFAEERALLLNSLQTPEAPKQTVSAQQVEAAAS
jgi:F0F1-type ATP synthase delta subunit